MNEFKQELLDLMNKKTEGKSLSVFFRNQLVAVQSPDWSFDTNIVTDKLVLPDTIEGLFTLNGFVDEIDFFTNHEKKIRESLLTQGLEYFLKRPANDNDYLRLNAMSNEKHPDKVFYYYSGDLIGCIESVFNEKDMSHTLGFRCVELK